MGQWLLCHHTRLLSPPPASHLVHGATLEAQVSHTLLRTDLAHTDCLSYLSCCADDQRDPTSSHRGLRVKAQPDSEQDVPSKHRSNASTNLCIHSPHGMAGRPLCVPRSAGERPPAFLLLLLLSQASIRSRLYTAINISTVFRVVNEEAVLHRYLVGSKNTNPLQFFLCASLYRRCQPPRCLLRVSVI